MTERDRMAKLIAKGKWHFILVHGVLGFGLLSATLVGLWELISRGTVTKEMVMPFIFFPLAGILWGASMWRFFQHRYDKAVRHAQHE